MKYKIWNISEIYLWNLWKLWNFCFCRWSRNTI